MLTDGNLYGQPIEWFSVQYAGWVWQVIDKIGRAGFDWEHNDLSRAEYDLLDEIKKIRQRRANKLSRR